MIEGRCPLTDDALFHFSGGWTHSSGLLAFGINTDQRHSADTFVTCGDYVAASPQIGLHFFGQALGHRQAAEVGAVLAEGTDEMVVEKRGALKASSGLMPNST